MRTRTVHLQSPWRETNKMCDYVKVSQSTELFIITFGYEQRTLLD